MPTIGELITPDTRSRVDDLLRNPGYNVLNLRKQGVELRKQEEARRQELEEHEASVFGGIRAAWQYDTFTGVAATYIKDMAEPVEESFDVKAAMSADSWEFPEGITWEQELLKGAKSEDHYNILKERVKGRREYLLNMEDLGILPSMGLQLVAEVGNIPNYFTFGLSALSKASRMKRFLTAGAITGTLNASEEKFIDTMYNDKTVTDYVVAGGLGFGLGWLGTLGGSSKAADAAHMDEVGNTFSEIHAKNSVDERVAMFRGEGDGTESTVGAQQIKDIHKTFYPDFDSTKTTPRMDENNDTVISAFHALKAGDIPQAKKIFTEKLGIASMAQSVHSSENPLARYLAGILIEHPEGVGRWNNHTAALDADLEFQKFARTYNPEYIRLKAAWNVLAEKSDGVKHTFDEAATVWIEGSGSVKGSNIQMDAILDEFNKLYKDCNEATYRQMRESGVMEATDDMDTEHMSRAWDGKAYSTARNKYGDDVLIETLQESILEGNVWKKAHAEVDKAFNEKVAKMQKEVDALQTKVDASDVSAKGQQRAAKALREQHKIDRLVKQPPDLRGLARRMAEAWHNRFLTKATSTTNDANLLSSANRSLLNDALDDLKLDPIDRGHIDAILESAGKDHKANPMKHQTGMKLGYTHKSGLRILDLMNNDLGSAFASKTRYWLGRSAAARQGLKSEEAFQQAIEQMKRHGSDRMQPDKDIIADAARLEAGWKMIMGQPLEDMSAPGIAAMRIVRKAMATASLGKLGIVQAGETGRVMAAVGVKNILQGIPMFKEMVMHLKDGRLDTVNLMDMEDALFGKIGAEHYMNHPDFRADDFGHKITKAEQQLDRMSYWLQKASGWQQVHTLQNKILMEGLAQKWYREFSAGTFSRVQMKDLGVPLHQYEGIKRMMKQHAKPIEGTNAMHLHVGDWEPELRKTFALMLHRKGKNAIQDIIAGETPLWMNSGIGKFIGQFRTFSVAALGKQTIHDYRMHKEGDQEAALALQFMLATSTMAVMTRMMFDAAVLPEKDRKKYIANNMNIRGITKRVLSYHGQLGPGVDIAEMLMSSVTPNTWGNITGNSQYRNGRGLASKVPGLSYINKAGKGISGLGKALMPGESMSKSDWNALVGVAPLSSWYGFHALNKRVVTPILFD